MFVPIAPERFVKLLFLPNLQASIAIDISPELVTANLVAEITTEVKNEPKLTATPQDFLSMARDILRISK